jgi:hypothetical protein
MKNNNHLVFQEVTQLWIDRIQDQDVHQVCQGHHPLQIDHMGQEQIWHVILHSPLLITVLQYVEAQYLMAMLVILYTVASVMALTKSHMEEEHPVEIRSQKCHTLFQDVDLSLQEQIILCQL